jgi:hypothetical protein
MVSKLIEKAKKDILRSCSLANEVIRNFGLDRQDALIALASIALAKRMAEERLKFNLKSIYPKDLKCDDIDVNLGYNLFAESLNKYRQGRSDFIGRNDLNNALNCLVRSLTK